jgi:hypothetical protein
VQTLAAIGREQPLNLLPKLQLDDCLMLAVEQFATVADLAGKKRVLEQLRQRASHECDTANRSAVRISSNLGPDSGSGKFVGKSSDRTKFKVSPEDEPHRLGFILINEQLPIVEAITTL